MTRSELPRIRVSAPDQALNERLANLPVRVVGPEEQADVEIVFGPEAETSTVRARKTLDAAGRHASNPGWTLGLPALTSTQPDAIARASRVTVPAASIAGALLLLRPLQEAGALTGRCEIAVSVSGQDPGADAASAIMRHAMLSASPRIETSEQPSETVAVRCAVSASGQTVARVHEVLASRYEHATRIRVLPAGPPQSDQGEANGDADTIALRLTTPPGQDGELLLTASLERDRTNAIVQAIALMLGLETADESPLAEQSDDQ